MASAEKKEVVTKTRTVVLTLTDEEAVVVRAILGNISGATTGLRRHTRQIYDALNGVGYSYFNDERVRSLSDNLHESLPLPDTFNG